MQFGKLFYLVLPYITSTTGERLTKGTPMEYKFTMCMKEN